MKEDLALFAVQHGSKLGVDYVDARLEDHYNEIIIVANSKVQRGVINRKRGTGVRTLVDGTWGFSVNSRSDKKRHKTSRENCVQSGKSVKQTRSNTSESCTGKAYKTSYKTKVKVDLKDVAFEDKLKQIMTWEKKLYTSKKIVRGIAEYTGIKIEKVFSNSDGARISFSNLWLGLR